MQKTVEQIDALEPSIKPLTDEQLKGKTLEFKERLTKGETVDDLLPEALRLFVKLRLVFLECVRMVYS